ncbi:MAG: ATP/GTP-binding protein, partial [Mycobacteriaceae bacterium]|nr:ATP/GTP-binding protein [Mycobacteriaceae bacterium]
MPRRKPRDQRDGRPLGVGDALRRVEEGPGDEAYIVRTVPGSRATKRYRCPGCDHEIMPGVAHVVVWPADASD